MKYLGSVLLLLIQCLFARFVYAETYTVLLYQEANPPYSYTENGEVKGIFADIFSAVSEKSHHNFEFISLSVARGLRYFDQGKVDIEPGVNEVWRKNTEVLGIFSLPYAYSREVVIGKPSYDENLNSFAKPEDFYGTLMGKVRGYHYGDFEMHFSDSQIMIYENRSEQELLAQLAHDRLDFVIVGDATAAYYKSRVPQYQNFEEVYEVSLLPVSLRFQPHLLELRKELDQVLTELIHSGTIEKIYRKYGMGKNEKWRDLIAVNTSPR